MNKLLTQEKNHLVFLAVFLISFASFSYEILLTRLFSVILSFNLVFLVVSFSILGMGLGGIYVYKLANQKGNFDFSKLLTKLVVMFPISIIGSILIMYKTPYIPLYLVYAIIGIAPFILSGAILSLIFKEYAQKSNTIYFMDLIGGAVGSLAIIKSMNYFGFMTSVVVVTSLTLLATICIAIRFKKIKFAIVKGILLVIAIGLIIEGYTLQEIEKNFTSYLTSPNTMISYFNDSDDEVVGIPYTKWNSISRTDVLETKDPREKTVVTDGGGSTPIIKFDGDFNKVQYLKKGTAYIPFAIGENDKSLVIGSGGGKDVLLALMGGSKDITAVEINSSTIDATQYFKDYSGDIYGRPEVKIYNQDGRNYINKTTEKYDNIYLSMVMTNAVENTMYSLSENYLFTEEAFREYFDKLTKDGKLSFMTHSSFDMARIVNTGIKVLLDRGIDQSEITDYFAIINGMSEDHKLAHGNMISMPMIIFKQNPFTDKEITELIDIVDYQKKQPIHYPGAEYELFRQLRDNEINYDEMVKSYGYNVKPITDIAPFFYNYTSLIPIEIIYIGFAALLVWFSIKKRYLIGNKNNKISKYFIGIGISFMLIEIPLVQKTTLYFGNPSYAFSGVLFSILLGTGLGSLISGNKKIKKFILNNPIYLLMVAISVITTLFTINQIMAITQDFSLIAKFITIFITLLPMSILMGIPFPIGIIKVKQSSDNDNDVPLMWGVNGLFSVIGSILAVAIATKFGFNVTIIIGALIYLYLYFNNPF